MLNEIDLSRTDLNLLTLFDTVLQQRHVGRAAERLNLSPSAVSHGLGRLRRLLNDPLFLRTPKGVVPTARALMLAEPIADILTRARNVIAGAGPFDPATSSRRFIVGAPDGVAAVFLPALLAMLGDSAPGIDLGLRQLLPPPSLAFGRAWQSALTDLESGTMDIAIAPTDDVPVRFLARTLYEEDFVIVSRAGHAFAAQPTLDRYCQMRHLVISLTGDPFGFVDDELTKLGHSRRVALTVPDWMTGLATIAETDLIAAMPRRFIDMHARRFGLVGTAMPLPLRPFAIRAVAPKVALMDAGLAWLLDLLSEAVTASTQTSATESSAGRYRPQA